jgi:hypothetical protein
MEKEMKSNLSKLVVAALLLGSLIVPTIASASQYNTINQRFDNQHRRIVEGNETGSLTRREDRKLAFRESSINAQVKRDRYFDNGHLNAFQRRRVNGELNQSSKEIYRLKHNDQVRSN